MNLKLYISIFLGLNFVFVIGQKKLFINEILSSNKSGIKDFQGQYTDWIELYNYDDVTIDLIGFHLSDDPSDLLKWSFPNTQIYPKSHLLLFLSGKDFVFNDEIHTNFKIDKDGELLFLSDPSGILIDSVLDMPLKEDESYGRISDGEETWVIQPIPSPDSNNITPFIINYSHESGFYDTEFELKLSTLSKNTQIRYTTDGKLPTSNSLVYNSPLIIENSLNELYAVSNIPTTPIGSEAPDFQWKSPKDIDKAVVIHYALFDNNKQLSKSESKIYFIDNSSDYNMPVISIVTDEDNLFGYESGIYVPGKAYDLDNGDPNNPNGNYRKEGWERKIDLTYFDENKILVDALTAGMRTKGKVSVSFPQKSFNLFFRKEYGRNKFYHEVYESDTVEYYKRLTFRNSGNDFLRTHFRDAYLQELLIDLDLETQRSRPSVVFINGEYWGIHNIRDKFDKHYFKSVFGIEEDNINILERCGIIDEGSNEAYFDLVDYISENNLADQTVYDSVAKQVDLINFIDYHIAQIYFASTDWPCNNVKFWKTNEKDSKWRYLVYDLDFSFGEDEGTSYDSYSLEYANTNSNAWSSCECANVIFTNLLLNKSFEKQFLNRFSYHMNHTFSIENTFNLLQKYKENYQSEMPRHIDRWGYPKDIATWELEIIKMEHFAKNRACFMKSNLEDYFGVDIDYTCEDLEKRKDQKNKLRIYPNPINKAPITIEYDGYSKGSNYLVYDHLGQVIEKGSVDQYPFIIDLSHLEIGMYLIKIDSGELIHTGKFIVAD